MNQYIREAIHEEQILASLSHMPRECCTKTVIYNGYKFMLTPVFNEFNVCQVSEMVSGLSPVPSNTVRCYEMVILPVNDRYNVGQGIVHEVINKKAGETVMLKNKIHKFEIEFFNYGEFTVKSVTTHGGVL